MIEKNDESEPSFLQNVIAYIIVGLICLVAIAIVVGVIIGILHLLFVVWPWIGVTLIIFVLLAPVLWLVFRGFEAMILDMRDFFKGE